MFEKVNKSVKFDDSQYLLKQNNYKIKLHHHILLLVINVQNIYLLRPILLTLQ